ncbi:MAG: DUF3473 domain-containing protein [Acidobacteria bacterium]|nr:DUF3473 domain-containing protein [Acidobacteriota bacterium]
MINAISIDLEDWFCAHNLNIKTEDWDKQELRITNNTERILEILKEAHTKATFFVLGWMAERLPELVRQIEQDGHEIATHGYSHSLLTEISPEQFEADLEKALHVTRMCVSQPIIGFRAPSFTVTRKTLWALDILKKHGIKYDSSIFPVGFHPDYGIPDAPLSIHKQDAIIEVPLSCAEILGRKIPCSGGGYFRIFPYFLTKKLMRQCNRKGRPVIFYFHPWEIDPGQPRKKLPYLKAFRHYFNLSRTENRLKKLLLDFEFAPIKEVVGLWTRI